ncbi:hypothetical protein LINGRAHAP2_LOCUS31022 [Linum grandiflorum]
MREVDDDCIRLRLFQWSLNGAAKRWVTSQLGGTFTTWAELSQAVLDVLYPPSKTNTVRESISRLHQKVGKLFL